MRPTKIIANGQVVELRSDGIPVQSFTQEQYEKLTDDERQNPMLCLVNEPPWYPTTISIQEYDTTTDDGVEWHVRKWSNGYCELSGKKIDIININTHTGGVYFGILYNFTYPFALVLKYQEHLSLANNVDYVLIPGYGIGTEDPLQKSTKLYALAGGIVNGLETTINLFVTGRWK